MHLKDEVKIEALLFDLDGTLVDTASDFIQVLNAQRLAYGLPQLPELLIRNTVSDGARALTELAFGGKEGEEKFEQKRTELLNRYAECVGDHSALFEGMDKVLALCEHNNIPWGIVTNKPRLYTDILLKKLELYHRSAITLCPEDVHHSKPNPESLLLAASSLKLNCKNTIYIGDHERDVQAGKAALMPTVAAQYGYIKDENDLLNWGADYIITHPSELISLFLPR